MYCRRGMEDKMIGKHELLKPMFDISLMLVDFAQLPGGFSSIYEPGLSETSTSTGPGLKIRVR